MTLSEAKDQIAASTVYKTWDNIKQELRGTSEYEDLMDRASFLLESELKGAKWLVKAYSKTMNLNLEAYEKKREKSRHLLAALKDLYSYAPDFPDRDSSIYAPEGSAWDQGLENATRNAKKIIDESESQNLLTF